MDFSRRREIPDTQSNINVRDIPDTQSNINVNVNVNGFPLTVKNNK